MASRYAQSQTPLQAYSQKVPTETHQETTGKGAPSTKMKHTFNYDSRSDVFDASNTAKNYIETIEAMKVGDMDTKY